MCLILFEWAPEHGAGRRLTVAANRDEFFHRATEGLSAWPGRHGILAAIDRGAEAGANGLPGTWMGVTTSGRFAALTNFRDPRERQTQATSRGQLVSSFLAGDLPCAEYLLEVQSRAGRYNGFNLLVGEVLNEEPQLWWYSNRAQGAPVKLTAGIYGISNALLDTPWPKLTRGVSRFCLALAAGGASAALFDVLADRTQAADHELPRTGVPLDWERHLSSIFVAHSGYGTRAAQVLRIDARGAIDYRERNFGPQSGGVFQSPVHDQEIHLQHAMLN